MGPPSFLPKKKDRQLCLCIDYHALNKNTISDSYLLLHIEELLSQLKVHNTFHIWILGMGISMSLLLKKIYTKWFFLVGMVYLSTLLYYLGL